MEEERIGQMNSLHIIDFLELLKSLSISFSIGGMLPKIKATSRFAKTGKVSVISSLQNAEHAFKCESGTIITK